MSVGDIYGGDYQSIGLSEKLIASSFGKVKDMKAEELQNIKKEVNFYNLFILYYRTFQNLY